MLKEKIAILGGGSWGKALASVYSKAHQVTIWTRDFVDHNIDGVVSTNNIEDIRGSKIVIIALPAQKLRGVLRNNDFSFLEESIIIIGSKGIEQRTLNLMSEVIEEELSVRDIAVLSGPNFAHEISSGLLCGASLSSVNKELLSTLTATLSNQHFALRPNTDIIGTQIFGALKNVVAIACGILYGKKLGQNAHSTLITFALQEVASLCLAKGGRSETSLELCGLGDMVLTCTSQCSRNVSFGMQIARGKYSGGVLDTNTVEGFYTSEAVYQLGRKLEVQMPVCTSVYNILYNKSCIDTEVQKMLGFI